MQLYFRKLGETGQPLVILHGVFGSSDNWQTLGRKLAEDFQVYLVDQRNHGRSPHDPEMTFEAMSEDLYELFRNEGIENAILIGHSMGGKTAMTFAQSHPELLHKLVVVDMGPKAYEMTHGPIIEGLMAIDLDELRSRGAADKALAEYIPDFGIRQFLLKNLYWVDKGKLGWRMNLPVLEAKFSNIIQGIAPEKVELPTLFIRGGKSGYISDHDVPAILDQFPNATVETIEKAGHWVHAEAPEEFYGLLVGFV